MSIYSPLYEQLADTLRDKIYEGTYLYGDKLPSEHSMAAEYGISHLTVRKALCILEKEGLIIKRRGKGTYVKSHQMTADMESIGSFSSIIRTDTTGLINKALYTGKRKAEFKYSHIFGIGPDDDVFEFTRLKSANDAPIAIEYTAVPSSYFPDIEQYDFNVVSIYDVYANHDISIQCEDQILSIVKIYNPTAALLNKDEGDEVFLLESTAKDQFGHIIEYTKLYNNYKKLIYYASSKNGKSGLKYE